MEQLRVNEQKTYLDEMSDLDTLNRLYKSVDDISPNAKITADGENAKIANLSSSVFPKPDFDVFVPLNKKVEGTQYAQSIELSKHPFIAPSRMVVMSASGSNDEVFKKAYRKQLDSVLFNDNKELNIEAIIYLVLALISASSDKKQTIVSYKHAPKPLINKRTLVVDTLNEFISENYKLLSSIAVTCGGKL